MIQWSGSASCVQSLQTPGHSYLGTTICSIAFIQELARCHVSMTLAFVHFHNLMHCKFIYHTLSHSAMAVTQRRDILYRHLHC